jgi:hypothetical protein
MSLVMPSAYHEAGVIVSGAIAKPAIFETEITRGLLIHRNSGVPAPRRSHL